jgi:hypothetical protein
MRLQKCSALLDKVLLSNAQAASGMGESEQSDTTKLRDRDGGSTCASGQHGILLFKANGKACSQKLLPRNQCRWKKRFSKS